MAAPVAEGRPHGLPSSVPKPGPGTRTQASACPGRRALLALAVGLALCSAATAQEDAGAPPGLPEAGQIGGQVLPVDGNTVVVLIRSTLIALDHANKTGNYSVLRELGAPSFEAANSTARLSQVFATQRAQALDMSAVAILEPRLRQMPQITADGLLHIVGYVPSGPVQVDFEFLFAPVGKSWELFGLSVNLSQSPPLPPAPAATEPAPEAGAAPAPTPRPPQP